MTLINIIKPKILHFHLGACIFDKEYYNLLNYRPVIITTIHCERKSPYNDYIDLIVCIHKASYDINTGNRVLIENFPSIDKRDINTSLENKRQFCVTCRFILNYLSEETIKLYGQLSGPVYIYGYIPNHANGEQILKWCQGEKNIHVKHWDNDVEKEITKHSIYAFYPALLKIGRAHV